MEDLPPGFRFYPTEEELVSFYLHSKLEGTREDLNQVMDRVIPVLDIYDYNPWDLPLLSGELCRGDPEQCFFFIERQESEARGGRPNRLTSTGYWKATGSPNNIYSSDNRIIGVKRTMVFYIGRAPSGRKTEWKMNEYKATEGEAYSSSVTTSATTLPPLRHELSVCRVYKKSKCLRAFDRRPQMKEVRYPTTQQVHSDEDQVSIVSGNPAPVGEKRISSSSESSSSGEHGQLLQTEGVLPMSVDNEALWYWDDQLNWF
ncbi:NAC domain-containing protein 90 [Ziziphus jujuba]|uniref:NAC domain-containing protein 90 n=1 Tax=Ziziphus jujuba TaxID=326968 RepID=A0A6P3ZMF8_ZIZJJ|nr:NAC domain-containing protein 90 [Ziziphus jujuba]